MSGPTASAWTAPAQARVDLLTRALDPIDDVDLDDGSERVIAAVLIPVVLDHDGATKLVFTERHAGLRKHAGEISFPGGRHDRHDLTLPATALREAEEEISLNPETVTLVGALPAVETFVSNFVVYPFVGVVDRAMAAWSPSPTEVERVFEVADGDLRSGFGERHLVRHGFPFKTETYVVGDSIVWGATARMLTSLLARTGEAPRGVGAA